MKYQLVIQVPSDSLADYDAMIALEDELIELLNQVGDVDGHDVGSGTMNIFIYTNQPRKVFDISRPPLVRNGVFEKARIAYRPVESDDYVILYPDGLEDFSLM